MQHVSVWKHLKVSEKDAKIITNTDNETLFSAASHVFHEKRRVVVAGYCMIEMASND